MSENKDKEITPDVVLKFTAPTKEFLCPMSANTYGIDFIAFNIRDSTTNKTLFEVVKDMSVTPSYPDGFDTNQLRTIHYKFPSGLLKGKTIGTKLKFLVGSKEIGTFRMIERHYFKGALIKSYDFSMKSPKPSATNEWETTYELPALSETQIADMVNSPAQTRSDSFYFVDNKLVMHSMATYDYIAEGKKIEVIDDENKKKEAAAKKAAAEKAGKADK